MTPKRPIHQDPPGTYGKRQGVVDPKLRRRFQRALLSWYGTHGRDLPWRRTSNPYHILVSEIMLQQTQVERVIPKYHEFLTHYPTMEDLARAPVQEVVERWRPLGYNIRPVHLHGIVREAVANYGGKLPDTPKALQSFKGIGRYTAGAILSFAYGKAVPILDTNVRRVLGRVFFGGKAPKGQKTLWELSEALLPRGKAYDFNQAIMDFGATVCTPWKPRCLTCPIRSFCKAFPR